MKNIILILTAAFSMAMQCQNSSPMQVKPSETTVPSTLDSASTLPNNIDTATLGGGCFWCLEAIFQDVIGVLQVESGYSGGHTVAPTYREVCSGLSGHAEVVQLTFDTSKISFREILDIFFTVHDPTTLNRQGADVGTQYRSVIFYRSEQQKKEAEAAKLAAAALWDKPVVTEISAFTQFYKAEAYHQNYYKNNPYQGYCQAVIAPKVKKFRANFQHKLKQ